MRKLTYEEIRYNRLSFDSLSAGVRFPIYVVLDNVRSMYNVGSIFRTSDASRIEQLILCGLTAHPPRKEIDKTALGSVDSVPWVYYDSTIKAVERLRGAGIAIVAVEHTDKSIDYRNFELPFPMAFIFGHEVWGISDEVLGMVDHAIEIPMYGIKQSLNLAVSYGIVVYHFVHRYLQGI